MSNPLHLFIRKIFALSFTLIFLGLAAAILISLVINVFDGIASDIDIMQIFLSSINTGVIGLAVFELALVINKEYSSNKEDKQEDDTIATLRRTMPRFIGTVCVALSLEGLIMVIKYSQLDLAGNLYYPVAVISCTALLLSALGLFLYLTSKHTAHS
ncbi:hypothetical protein Q4503_18440 [Colwellia sp. 6_MG-2023]|jgi:hypothetical protein|uniref:hypothetical protein n=1 Tax=Colwellia sp. 6_MG-2023 TaxID=3062676 RepID=UPI0026E29DD9|nr:hypothetical protein [Colwellia sp. 6_MG-2023]MDO6489676.1 hypothetical protein [Colwellia sp. 6_MG-2023]